MYGEAQNLWEGKEVMPRIVSAGCAKRTPGRNKIICHFTGTPLCINGHKPMGMVEWCCRADPLAVLLQAIGQLLCAQGRQRWGVDLQVVGENEAGHGVNSVTKTLTGLSHPR